MPAQPLSPARVALLNQLAANLPSAPGQPCARVAIDGPDGAGKTVLADQLAAIAGRSGRQVIRASVDDFHNVRAVRYRRGRDSPQGYWLDSFDYARLRADLLAPLGPGGDGWYIPAVHDLLTDEVLHPPRRRAATGSVLIVDGVFLHRDELADCWEYSIFLEVPFDVTAARMAIRDGSSADPAHPGLRRYQQGQRLYFAACSPQLRAGVLIDNSSVDAPAILRALPTWQRNSDAVTGDA